MKIKGNCIVDEDIIVGKFHTNYIIIKDSEEVKQFCKNNLKNYKIIVDKEI
jgi:hypothetical protein